MTRTGTTSAPVLARHRGATARCAPGSVLTQARAYGAVASLLQAGVE